MTLQQRPIIIGGASGSGKSTLYKEVGKRIPISFCVSHTTRQPRPGEVNGIDYYFVTREKFQQMLEGGEFLEHAEFSGNLYGTSLAAIRSVLDSGKFCVLDIEINGATYIRRSGVLSDLNPVFIYIDVPSAVELEKRLRGRGTETEDSLQRRLKLAQETSQYVRENPDIYDCVIVNDEVPRAANEMYSIITGEKCVEQQQTGYRRATNAVLQLFQPHVLLSNLKDFVALMGIDSDICKRTYTHGTEERCQRFNYTPVYVREY